MTITSGKVDVNDKTGFSLTQNFPANFADLTITASTGQVTAGTVSDKTGYALTSAYDSAKTAAQTGDAMTLTSAYDAAKTAATQTSVNAIPTNPLTTLGTNAPAGWINAAAIGTAAFNGKGDWLLASSYTAPPSAASIATTIFTDLMADSDFSTSGSFGKLIKDDINATVSSRSTYSGSDTSGITTLLSRLPSALTITSGKIDVNDKTGFSLISAYDPAKVDPLSITLPGSYTGHQAGALLWRMANRPGP